MAPSSSSSSSSAASSGPSSTAPSPSASSTLARRAPLTELPIANFVPRPPSPVKMHSSPSKLGLSSKPTAIAAVTAAAKQQQQRSHQRSSSSSTSHTRNASTPPPRHDQQPNSSRRVHDPFADGDLEGAVKTASPRGCPGPDMPRSRHSSSDRAIATAGLATLPPPTLTNPTEDIEGRTPPMPSSSETAPAMASAPKSLGRKKDRVRVGEMAQALMDQDEDMGHVRAGSPSPATMKMQRKDALQGSSGPSFAMLEAAVPAGAMGLGIGSTLTAVSSAAALPSALQWTVLADDEALVPTPVPHASTTALAPHATTPDAPPLATDDASLASVVVAAEDKENRKPDRVLLQAHKRKGTGGRLSLVADAEGDETVAAVGSSSSSSLQPAQHV